MGSLNASRWTTMRYLRLRAPLPYIFSCLRIAAPLSLIGAILVDFLGARNGIGYLLIASLTLGSSQSTLLSGALVLAMAFGLIFRQLVVVVEKRMSFWQPAFRAAAARACARSRAPSAPISAAASPSASAIVAGRSRADSR